jgi:hypothetical protein
MNLKKLFLTAGIVASVSTPAVAQDLDFAAILGDIDFGAIDFGQLFTVAFAEITASLPALIEIATESVTAIIESGFDLDVIVSTLSEIAVNVGALVVAAVTNIGFAALGSEISAFVQAFVEPFDPFDVTDIFFENGWINTTEDGECLGFSYTVVLAELVGFSEAELTELKILDQKYTGDEESDGKVLSLHATAAVGNAAANITMTGMVKETDCDNPDKEFPEYEYDARYLKDNVEGSGEVKLEAVVEGQNFNISSATVIKLETKFDDLDMTVTSQGAFGDDIKPKLGEELAAAVDALASFFLEQADNITLINELAESALPFGFELPFAWPLP